MKLKNAVTKSRSLDRVLIGENIILQNPIGGGDKWGGETGTMAELTAGHQ